MEVHRLKILVGNAFNDLKAAYEADHEGLHFDVIVQAWLHCRYISGLDDRYGKLIETLEELETQLKRAQGYDFLPKWRARKMNMHDLINKGQIQGSNNIERAAKFMELIELKLKPDRVNKASNEDSVAQTETTKRRVPAMVSPAQKIKKIWTDPVWSKVIATAIIFTASTVAGYLWFSKENSTTPVHIITSPSTTVHQNNQNIVNKNNDASGSININRSNNVTVNQNIKSDNADNPANRLKEALRALDSIESYMYYPIDSEPEQYQALLARARNEIRFTNNIKGRTHELIISTYDCYHEAGDIWKDNCPSALLSRGVASLYDNARNQFQQDILPRLSLEWRKCSEYLKKSHEYFEMEQ